MARRRIKVVPGQRFGRLVVLREEPRKVGKDRHVICQCDCGNQTVTSLYNIGKIANSCGCLGKERRLESLTTHGATGTPEHYAWKEMFRRCEDENSPQYKDWGGRGIVVDPVFNDFETFLKEVGERPSPEHSIDRIDNSKDYEPGNLRWATRKEQCRNRRSNVLLEFRGRTMLMIEWAEELGMKKGTLSARLRLGWSVEKALTTPVKG